MRLGIRGKVIASMMATLIPFLALSLYWSYRELQAERGMIQLETLRFASSGATIADEFVTATEQVLMTVAETPAVKARDRWLLNLLVKNLKPKFPYFLNLIVVDERGDRSPRRSIPLQGSGRPTQTVSSSKRSPSHTAQWSAS